MRHTAKANRRGAESSTFSAIGERIRAWLQQAEQDDAMRAQAIVNRQDACIDEALRLQSPIIVSCRASDLSKSPTP
jgi:hypothetical protein